MSEKRFEISKDKYFIFDNTEDDFLDLEDVVNKLNALAEEIEELKLENKKLKNENEVNNRMALDIDVYVEHIRQIDEEKSQLKKWVDKLIEILYNEVND